MTQHLVIHVNAFTHKIAGGYWVLGTKKVSTFLTPAEVTGYLAANPTVPVDFMHI
jgi:hypothetical protein